MAGGLRKSVQTVKAEQNVHTCFGAHARWSSGVHRSASTQSGAGVAGRQFSQKSSSRIVAHDAPATAHVLSLRQ